MPPENDPKPDDDTKPDPKDDAAAKLKELEAERDKWKVMARKHEDEEKKAKEELAKLKSTNDADKSEIQKATERIADLEKRHVESEARALRAEIAAEKKLTPAQAKRLQGTTREELEADADELLEAFKPSTDTGDGSANGKEKPKEKLRSGAAGSDDDAVVSGKELLDKMPRAGAR